MAFQAIIRYHCDLMSRYRTIDSQDFATKDEAINWLNERMEELTAGDDDPENPLSDLYDTHIQEV